jgi:4-hydroxy-4-methyl-2-oxoglutarate aldolase
MHSWVYKYACSGMFSDELDKMDFPKQVIAGLRSNNPNQKFYGQIRTLQLETIKTKDENISTGLRFLENMAPGEILCVEASSQFAYFDEMMVRISLRQKLGGVIIGGLTRDSAYTQKLTELLILADGYSPRDIKGRGRIKNTDIPIRIKDILVNPGDWAFGDSDGIVIIPEPLLLEVDKRIIQRINEEASIARAINDGLSIEELLKKQKEYR